MRNRTETRDEALTAGRRVLASEGFRGLTARRIASDIGVSVGTLYNLFEDFDELILCLNLETLGELETALAGCEIAGKPPLEAVHALASCYLAFTAEHHRRWLTVLNFKTPEPHRFWDDFRAVIARLVAHVELALAPLFADGEERERARTAVVLWTSLEGIGAMAAANNMRMVAPFTAQELAHSLVENYMRGLMKS